MKEIVSKNLPSEWVKRRKKDKIKLKTYWSNLYPIDYTKDMVKEYSEASIWKPKQ